MAEPDQVLGRKRHAEAEIRSHLVGVALAEAAEHLHDGQAAAAKLVDDRRIGSLGGRKQQPVDAMLAHAGDEAVLAGRRLRRVGKEGHPSGAIEGVVDAGGELGVERVGDLADDEPDRLRRARTHVRRGAIIDVSERADRRLHALARPRGNERAVPEHKRHRRRRDAGMLGDVLEGLALAQGTRPRFGSFPKSPS